MENTTILMKEEDEKQMREEPKTLSKNELAALREAAMAMLKVQEGQGKPSRIFLKGEQQGASQCRPATNPSG